MYMLLKQGAGEEQVTVFFQAGMDSTGNSTQDSTHPKLKGN